MRSIFIVLAILCCSWGGSARADEPAAARYIRDLFDATLLADPGRAPDCADIAGFGRFAAGSRWRALPDAEKPVFDQGFCALGGEGVAWLRDAFPGLRLEIASSAPAPQQMTAVRGVAVNGTQRWRVDWLVAGEGTGQHLADMRIEGISLGIFLRSLAAQATPAGTPLTADDLLSPWRRALDRARKAQENNGSR